MQTAIETAMHMHFCYIDLYWLTCATVEYQTEK